MSPVPVAPLHPITEDDIANYLVQTPGFFERHAEVLAAVQLRSPHAGRAVSLHERQVELLRDKMRALEHKLAELLRYGHENVAIGDKLQSWTLGLLKAAEPAELPERITQGLERCFGLPQVALRVWDVAPAYVHLPAAQPCSEDVKDFASSLMAPYCGANPGLEALAWLAEPQRARSLALVALREEPAAAAFGLLVLASDDVSRFTADMGTDFLERIGELASAALVRLR